MVQYKAEDVRRMRGWCFSIHGGCWHRGELYAGGLRLFDLVFLLGLNTVFLVV